MSRICYVNGEYVHADEAKISIFDRGFLFADGIYEVSSVVGGQLLDNVAHLARMHRSLGELKIPVPCSDCEIVAAQKELIKRNEVSEGVVYLQVSRGSADRDFAFPVNPKPSLVMFTQHKKLLQSPQAKTGIRVITVPDIRWQRRDIKTVSLLAQSMAKQAALDAGVHDAWMVEGGHVTEGSSNNAFIVTAAGTLVTRHLGSEILHGITRAAVLRLVEAEAINFEQRAFSVAEALAASEAFSTSASTFVLPVIEIDAQPIGSGQPGPIAQQLRKLYIETALQAAS